MTVSLVISIISFSLCVAGFFFLRWYISRRITASQLLEEYRDEVDRLIAGIHAATDKNLLLMEDKIKTLKKFMEDTDKRISVYTREIQRSRNSEAIYKNLGRGIREALDSIPAGTSPSEPVIPAVPETASSAKTTTPVKKAPSDETAELPFTDEEKGKGSRSGSTQTRGAKKQKKRKTTNVQTPAVRPEKQGIKMQIAQMAIQGLSPSEIASRLGISLAEVDLALQLLKIGSGE